MDANLLQYLQQSAADEELNKNKYRQLLTESKDRSVNEYINPSQSVSDIDTTANIQNVLGQASSASSNNPTANLTGLSQIMQNIGKQGQQGATENLANKMQYKTVLEDVLKQIAVKDYLGQTDRTLNSQLTEDTLANKLRVAQEIADTKKAQAKKQFVWNLITGGLAGAGQGITQGAAIKKDVIKE